MNNQLNHYISIEPDFFQELEGEFGVKITGMRDEVGSVSFSSLN